MRNDSGDSGQPARHHQFNYVEGIVKLRNPDDILISDMSYYDIRQYILKMEEEILKLRTAARAHKKSIREMQRVLEQQHLRQKVLEEWRELKKLENQVTYVGIYPAPPPLNSGSWSPNFGKLEITCDTE
jgi:hypothetical protein